MSFVPLTKEQLIELWRTLFSSGFTTPIEDEAHGQGLDVFAMQAAIMARAGQAANETMGRLYIRPHSTQTSEPASGAARAAADLFVSRDAPAADPFTFIIGTQFPAFYTGLSGERIAAGFFRVVEETTLNVGQLAVVVPTEAVRVGESGNVPAGSITGFAPRGTARIVSATIEAGNVLRDRAGAFGGDRLTPAMVGQYVRLVGGTNGGMSPRRVISVTQPTSTDPTASAVLDGAALSAPDTLTRADVVEFDDLGLSVTQPEDSVGGLDAWLDTLGHERNIERQLGESDDAYRIRIETLPDVVSPAAMLRAASRVLSPLGIEWRLLETRDPYGLRGFVCDVDPCDEGDVSDGMVTLSDVEAVRFFIMLVGLGDQGEFGMFCDTYTHPTVDACDVGFCDGEPMIYNSAIAQLWAELYARHGGGIRFDIVRSASL